MKKLLVISVMGLALASAGPAARVHQSASEASALSMLPVAVAVAAPVALLSAGAVLTVVVVVVEAASTATVWVPERASDGARASITLVGQVAGGLSVVAGTAVVATAFSAGWVLSAAGQAIAYIPNQIGKALLNNERLTR